MTLELVIPENAPVVVDDADEDEHEDEDEHDEHDEDEDEHSEHDEDEDEHSDHDEDEVVKQTIGPFGLDKVLDEEDIIELPIVGAEEGEDGAFYLTATSTFLSLLVGSTLFL